MKIKNIIAILCLSTCYFSIPLFAADVTLFIDGKPIHFYNERVTSLQEGDVVFFSNGTNFRLLRKLGVGGSDYIFEIDGDKAIRISKCIHLHPRKFSHLNLYPILHENGVSVVTVYPEESRDGEYVIVQKEKVLFTLLKFYAHHPRNRPELTLEERSEIESSLIEFARTTMRFVSIDDFKPENIAWNGKKWILLDWDDGYKLAKLDGSSLFKQTIPFNTFRFKNYLSSELMSVIEQAIQEERKQTPRKEIASLD